jgi:spermidine synthase
MEVALLASVFVVAACGLVYELAAGALASYVLGDSVLQFSTVIGTYLFAMGVGSWASRFFDRQLPAHFLRIELLVALAGGFMPTLLFVANAYQPTGFRALLYGLVFIVGVLVGIEIPLVMRILKRNIALRELVSQVLTFDYLGALAVSIAFPIVLVPHLGLVRTGLLFGVMNALVAVWTLRVFRHEMRRVAEHAIACTVSIAALVGGFAWAQEITTLAEDKFYQDPVVYAATSPYQRIVVTRGRGGYRLFLNGNLQFAERDEYRYHEALVHPVMSAHGGVRKVAILGGGDGMAAREVLRYPQVEGITLVDLDANMTRLFSTNDALVRLNVGSLLSKKLKVINTDAFQWLQDTDETFDVIIVDFPDPTNFSIGKLYTTSFYALLDKHLAASGYAVIQTTSPLVARESYWTVVTTLESVGFATAPYHTNVPSFGEWGFVVASHRPFHMPAELPNDLKFLTPRTLPLLFDFPRDMARVPAEPNRLSNQVLVTTYEKEWGKVLP